MSTPTNNRRVPIYLSTFQCDITPPPGHPLCGGWVPPVAAVHDPLWAHGLILQCGGEAPVVLVALDWTGVLNQGYDDWRQQIAVATGTSRERVFVHCVHQHEALWADPEAELLVHEYGTPRPSLDLNFFQRTIRSVAEAAGDAMVAKEEVTHIGTGEGEVQQVASSRRIKRPDGTLAVRFSASRDEELRNLPEGLIDPQLKTLSLWNGDRMLAALHFYATHPITNFGSGLVTADFVGMARAQLHEETGVPQIYFTGGAGNIGPGKYNDGSPEMMPMMAERILVAMRAALANTRKESLESMNWTSIPIRLSGRRSQYDDNYCLDLLKDHSRKYVNLYQEVSERFCAASKLVWLRRTDAGHAIDFGCLGLNEVRVFFFPGEPFVEYQLYAQKLNPENWVAFAGYGDGGPGYLPTNVAFEEGGFEPGIWSYIEPCEALLCGAIAQLTNKPALPLAAVLTGKE